MLLSAHKFTNMKSKSFLAFFAGAALGVAVGYMLNSEHRDEVTEQLRSRIGKLKSKLRDAQKGATDLASEVKKAASDN